VKTRAKAEERLRAYREGNKGTIEENKRMGMEEAEMERRREKAEREAANRED